ncbi:MAG: hypothetical protein GY757_08535, partial [bacterium]|nr:hypothetical protein [bacterium]
MRVKYPFEKTTAKELLDNNRKGSGGFYPLGVSNLWHGGIHLYSPKKPIRCIADGKIIAYRITKQYIVDAPYNRKDSYSNCFVLVEHTFVSPKGQEIKFYSLYMHLLPWELYESRGLREKDRHLHFFLKHTHAVNHEKNGEGLKIVNSEDKVIKVLPCDSLFSYYALPLKPGADHWSKNADKSFYIHARRKRDGAEGFSANKAEYLKKNKDGTFSVVSDSLNLRSYDDYNKKFPLSKKGDILTPITDETYTKNLDGFDQDPDGFVIGKSGLSLARIIDREGTEVIGFIGLKPENHDVAKKPNLFRLKKAKSGFTWDVALPKTGGANIRERLNTKKEEKNNVLRVLPKGTPLVFEDEDHFYKATTDEKYFQLAKTHFGEDAWIWGAEVDSTQYYIPQELGKVVTLDSPVDIQAGEVVGYAGKYKHVKNMFHLEVFSPDLDFWDNQKGGGDKTKNTYRFPSGTEFKLKKDLTPDLEFKANDVIQLEKQESNSIREAKQAPFIFLWLHRDELGTYNKKGAYQVGDTPPTFAYRKCTSSGVVSESDQVEITVEKNAELNRFSNEQRKGTDKGYCQVVVKLEPSETQRFEFTRQELETYCDYTPFFEGKQVYIVNQTCTAQRYSSHDNQKIPSDDLRIQVSDYKSKTILLKKGDALNFATWAGEKAVLEKKGLLVPWVHYDQLGEWNEDDKCFKRADDCTVDTYRDCSEKGKPIGDRFKIDLKKDEILKAFLLDKKVRVRKDRGFRAILVPRDPAKTESFWFDRSVSTDKTLRHSKVDSKHYYVLKKPLKDFYSSNPIGFKEKAVATDKILDITSGDSYKLGDEEWVGFPLTEKQTGWMKKV